MTIRTISCAALLALIAGTGVAAATNSGSERPGAPTSAPPAQSIPAELTKSFALLRDTAPNGSMNAVTPDSSPVGANRTLARTVSTAGAGIVRVIPGSDGVCLEVSDGAGGAGGGCQLTADVMAGRLTVALVRDPSTPDRRTIIGLVPDGVTSVTVGNETSKVSSNMWTVTTNSADRTASYTDAAGSHPILVP